MLRRWAPAFLLFLLSPLIAEYLLGNLSITQASLLPVMMGLYGGGAVLIREFSRRMNRGWPTILVLALAYGLLEEGVGDQALFNAHFRGMHLLDYGFVPSLGIGVPLTVDLLCLHVVWSIGVPIALVEALFADRRTEPWLRKAELPVFALFYVCGFVFFAFTVAQEMHFMATWVQLGGVSVISLALIAVAFLLPPRGRMIEKPVPSPWLVGFLAFVAGSAFELLYGMATTHAQWQWQIVASGMLAIATVMLALGLIAGRRSGWSQRHTFAMAMGALLVYVWLGFVVEITFHGTSMLWVHAILASVILALAILAGFRVRRAQIRGRAAA